MWYDCVIPHRIFIFSFWNLLISRNNVMKCMFFLSIFIKILGNIFFLIQQCKITSNVNTFALVFFELFKNCMKAVVTSWKSAVEECFMRGQWNQNKENNNLIEETSLKLNLMALSVLFIIELGVWVCRLERPTHRIDNDRVIYLDEPLGTTL